MCVKPSKAAYQKIVEDNDRLRKELKRSYVEAIKVVAKENNIGQQGFYVNLKKVKQNVTS